jgi:hypothetical protein
MQTVPKFCRDGRVLIEIRMVAFAQLLKTSRSNRFTSGLQLIPMGGL